jgi:MFS family permease
MLGARLGDRFGHRRIIFTGLVIFAAAAAMAATAPSVIVLTAARCLQGAAAALSVPSALRLLTTITPDGAQRRKAASGIINTAAQLGTALGIAALLLVAAVTTGVPGPGKPVGRCLGAGRRDRRGRGGCLPVGEPCLPAGAAASSRR